MSSEKKILGVILYSRDSSSRYKTQSMCVIGDYGDATIGEWFSSDTDTTGMSLELPTMLSDLTPRWDWEIYSDEIYKTLTFLFPYQLLQGE